MHNSEKMKPYNQEEAHDEANKIRAMVSNNANHEDYEKASQIVDEENKIKQELKSILRFFINSGDLSFEKEIRKSLAKLQLLHDKSRAGVSVEIAETDSELREMAVEAMLESLRMHDLKIFSSIKNIFFIPDDVLLQRDFREAVKKIMYEDLCQLLKRYEYAGYEYGYSADPDTPFVKIVNPLSSSECIAMEIFKLLDFKPEELEDFQELTRIARQKMINALKADDYHDFKEIKKIFPLFDSMHIDDEIRTEARNLIYFKFRDLIGKGYRYRNLHILDSISELKDDFQFTESEIEEIVCDFGWTSYFIFYQLPHVISQGILSPDAIQKPEVKEKIIQALSESLSQGLDFLDEIEQYKEMIPDDLMESQKFKDAARQGIIVCLERGEVEMAVKIKNNCLNQEVGELLDILKEKITNYDWKMVFLIGRSFKECEKEYVELISEQTAIAQNSNLSRKERQGAFEVLIGLVEEGEDEIPINKDIYKKFRLTLKEYLHCALEVEDLDDKMEDEDLSKEIFRILRSESPEWQDNYSVIEPFVAGAEYFGYNKMFEYLDRENLSRHDGLHNFRQILELAQKSDLPHQKFFNNILLQVQKDKALYDVGTSHHRLNFLANSIDMDFESVMNKARRYSGIKKLQGLISDLDTPEKVFGSWKNLKKYEEICQLLYRSEILEQLIVLKGKGKEKLHDYVETLAFHPNISMEKVMMFWNNPEEFLNISDDHTPDYLHDRKKPSNYFSFPNLDLTAEELRDALVEGVYDKVQVFKPLEIEYQIADMDDLPIQGLIYKALGRRAERIKGEAADPKKTFSVLSRFFKEKGVDLMQYLKSASPEESYPQVTAFSDEIKAILFDNEFGMYLKIEEYRAKINLKSDPEGVVAGNDTACCMPFGSGKNNIYTFNPVCQHFIVQRKNEKQEWRTVAQSILTKDIDIGRNIAELRLQLEQAGIKMHEVVGEEVLVNKKKMLACDNIEVSQNFKDHPQVEKILKSIYRNFFREYMNRFAKEDNLDDARIPIGMGFTDAFKTLPIIENTFIPEAPVGYSDKLQKNVFVLDLMGAEKSDIILKRGIKSAATEKTKTLEHSSAPIKGISYLTFEDSLSVAYIEGKAYKDNENLMEHLHSMENALIAKDINNAIKARPNMSFKYTGSDGMTHGYVLAYEGVARLNYSSDYSEPADNAEGGRRVIYVSDLASDGSKKAGGALILAFIEAYKKNYVENKNLLPIYAQFREKTSYQIIVKHLEKIAGATGMKFD